MLNENMINQLKGIGMSEYESKIYLMLLGLNMASPRELHEMTGIPRGRVYETLNSLSKRGFVVANGESPARFRASDIHLTVERLKHEATVTYDNLERALENYEQTTASDRLARTYSIQSLWSIENHIRMILKRAKAEILIFCDDPSFYEKYAEDIDRITKHVKVYCIISDKKLAKEIPFECYLANRDTKECLLHPPITRRLDRQTKLILYADRKEALTVFKMEGREEAVFTTNNIYAEFITRVVLKSIAKVYA
jgi:sugar-specific transcriptional regulator TrmB